jgi:hypothetical protein
MSPKKINDNTLLKYNDTIIKIPNSMIATFKNGNEKIVKGLTNKGNIKKVNSVASIIL